MYTDANSAVQWDNSSGLMYRRFGFELKEYLCKALKVGVNDGDGHKLLKSENIQPLDLDPMRAALMACLVGRCNLTPVLKARLVSALETKM